MNQMTTSPNNRSWILLISTSLSLMLTALFAKIPGITLPLFILLFIILFVIQLGITFMMTSGNSNIQESLIEIIKSIGKGDFKTAALNSISENPTLNLLTNSIATGIVPQLKQMKNTSASLRSSTKMMQSTSSQIKDQISTETQMISETAAAIAELSASITEIAQSAEHIKSAALKTTNIAQKGGTAVNSMVEGMNRITDRIQEVDGKLKILVESNKKINGIINVITEIAEQTNLLALNAAIEAARAGDQGRGFAVVADEVRLLAERSQKSAAEVVELIEKTNQQSEEAVHSMREGESEVQQGTELSNNAGQSLKDIINHIKDVSSIIADISSAVNEQAHVSETITANMDQINQISKGLIQSSNEFTIAASEVANMSQTLDSTTATLQI